MLQKWSFQFCAYWIQWDKSKSYLWLQNICEFFPCINNYSAVSRYFMYILRFAIMKKKHTHTQRKIYFLSECRLHWFKDVKIQCKCCHCTPACCRRILLCSLENRSEQTTVTYIHTHTHTIWKRIIPTAVWRSDASMKKTDIPLYIYGSIQNILLNKWRLNVEWIT